MIPNSMRNYGSYGMRPFYRPGLSGPLGMALLACGIIAIGSMLAPAALEQAIPEWRARFGLLVTAGVVFGFIRSVWRMFIPLIALAFWIVAIFAIVKPQALGLLPTILASTTQTQNQTQPQIVPASLPSVPSILPVSRHSSPALPDAAYFPPVRSVGGSSFLDKLPLPAFLKRALR